MNNWRQFISIALVVSLLHLSLADVAWPAGSLLRLIQLR